MGKTVHLNGAGAVRAEDSKEMLPGISAPQAA